MRVLRLALIAAVLTLVALAAQPVAAAETVRVGYIGPLTGIFAQAGKDMLDGLKLALEQATTRRVLADDWIVKRVCGVRRTHRVYDNLVDPLTRAFSLVDQILKSAKPEDLPVEQPTNFQLIINAKPAKALGPTLSPSLLARADQVID